MCAWHIARGETARPEPERSGFIGRAARPAERQTDRQHNPAVSRSAGRPLDAAARGYFEPRFGHDFSQVRVHTDTVAHTLAASNDALAYAAGQDIGFASGQYRPHTTEGRWLIGHELAHVVQQRGSTASSRGAEGALEKDANAAATGAVLGRPVRVAAACNVPAVQFAPVSNGGFGKALEEYTNLHSVEDKAVDLLKKSPTFMGLIGQLDPRYVWFRDPAVPGQEFNTSGQLTKPPAAAGKRTMLITQGGGSRFEAYGSPDNPNGSDMIVIEPSDTPGFIQRIAHEATHAAAFVGAARPQPQSLADEIKAGLKDEIAARTSEAQVLKEVPKAIAKGAEPVGARTERDVQRDLSPGFNLTYLELFFFARELRDAQAAEKLDDDAAKKLRDEIDRFHGAYSTGLTEQHWAHSRYGRVWFDRVTAQREWQDFMQRNSPQDPGFLSKKETMLQNHAKWFFYGKVAYLA